MIRHNIYLNHVDGHVINVRVCICPQKTSGVNMTGGMDRGLVIPTVQTVAHLIFIVMMGGGVLKKLMGPVYPTIPGQGLKDPYSPLHYHPMSVRSVLAIVQDHHAILRAHLPTSHQ